MTEPSYPFQPNAPEQLSRRTAKKYASGKSHVPYVYNDEIILAVNAALSTRRPLLLRGAPGSGKSTMAKDASYALGRDFDERVITSRTSAQELLWEFDAVERLGDAPIDAARAKVRKNYVRRGVLWNAFAPEDESTKGIVILIDEIDKADPDLPNDLLVPLGEDRFRVTDLPVDDVDAYVRRARDVLVVITTNGERDLPPAFLRRCVSLTLKDPSEDKGLLEEIATRHLKAFFADKQAAPPAMDDELKALLGDVVARAKGLSAALGPNARRAGTAEILDAFKACVDLGITSKGHKDWATLTRVLLHKDAGDPEQRQGAST